MKLKGQDVINAQKALDSATDYKPLPEFEVLYRVSSDIYMTTHGVIHISFIRKINKVREEEF